MRLLPPLAASSAEGATVVATGVVRVLDTPLTARLSRRSCVWFESTVGTFKARGAQRFLLDGAHPSVEVVVDPAQALVKLPAVSSNDLDRNDVTRLRVVYADHEGLATPFETIVEVGASVSVAGVLTYEARPAAAYRDAFTRVVLVPADDAPIVIVEAL